MLPDDVWDSYYDIPCGICKDTIRWRHEDHGSCQDCNEFMCEDCVSEARFRCDVCDQDQREEEDHSDCVTRCMECLKSCEDCGVPLHPECVKKHKKLCNPKGRAKRALTIASDAVRDGEYTVEHARRRLEEAEAALKNSKAAKKRAKRDYSTFS